VPCAELLLGLDRMVQGRAVAQDGTLIPAPQPIRFPRDEGVGTREGGCAGSSKITGILERPMPTKKLPG